MAITRVQTASGNNSTGGTTVSATWGSATTNHNCLVAMISHLDSAITITIPTNTHWQSVKTVTGGSSPTLRTQIFVWPDCGIQSGAVTFTLSASTAATIHIVEYSGVQRYNNVSGVSTEILDGTTSSSGTGTTVGASSSGTTTDANDVLISVLNQVEVQTFSSPTQSFSIVNQTNTTDTTDPGWTFNNGIGGNNSKAAGTTVVITTTATVIVGKLIVVFTGWDNTDIKDVSTTRLTVSDSAGNTYTQAKDFVNGEGAAGDGAHAAIFYSKVTAQLASGGTITVTSDTSRTAKAAAACYFTFTGGGVVSVAGSATNATDGADPAAMTISSLTSKKYLWLGCAAREGVSTGVANDADYASCINTVGTSGGSAVSNMSVHGAYRVFTGTTDTYDMGWTSADFAQVYVALDITITDTNQSSAFLERIPAGTSSFYTQCTSTTSKAWISTHITLFPAPTTVTQDWVYGSYAGAGSNVTVTGVGMRPDLIFTFNNNIRAKGVYLNNGPQIAGNTWAYGFDNTGVSRNNGTAFIYTTSDGWVNGSGFSNSGGDTFHYHAFKKAWPTDTAFDYGQYMGDGTDPRTINLSFAPAMVMVYRTDKGYGTSFYGYRTTSNSGDDSLHWEGSTGRADFIQGFGATSFDVGASLNATGVSYVWAAFADTGSIVEGGFKVGSYTGTSGVDDRNITVATGFVPTLIFNQNKSFTFATNARFDKTEADDKYLYFSNIAENSNGIQRTHANGFQVGSDDNYLTSTYLYCCWIAAAAGSTPATGTAVVDPVQSFGITPYER